MATDKKTMTTQELTEVVKVLLEREERREATEQKRKRSQAAQRRRVLEQSVARTSRSIEVIKWCVVGISTVMALALVVMVIVVNRVHTEAERIKSEVQQIQHEAERIRDKIRHPLESLGGYMGRQMDSKVGELIEKSSGE